jgi:Zn-dependent protease/predicted transcriptional regulator
VTDLRLGAGERSGMRLFNVLDIEIRLDMSVVLIFGLIVYSLGGGLFPEWHPDWTPALRWATAFAGGFMFFASLLAHELAHSLVARRLGIRVPRITLFLFGGVAEIEAEAETPQAEFAIAIAGPLMSLALGFVFGALAGLGMGGGVAGVFEQPQSAIAGLDPVLTVALWLGSVNLMLALFNMIPGFPLDGGRVFRAAVWRVTGDHLLASRLASTAGRWFGWALMAYGAWSLLATRDPGGLWLVMIGWFLSHLASSTFSQILAERALRSLKVRDVMRTRFDTVPATATLDDFVENYLLRSSQGVWPVVEEGRVTGLVANEDVIGLPVADRGRRRVRDVMTELGRAHTLDADTQATHALRALLAAKETPVAVLRDGTVVGLVLGSDVLRWITLHRDRATPDRADIRMRTPRGRGR